MRLPITLALLLPLCFASGRVIGTIDYTSIKKAVADSYINRYNAMSGNNVTEVIYYVVGDNQTTLDQLALHHPGINKVTSAGYPGMFNVHINYSDRINTLKKLRQLSDVTAVFTVPFICH